jgi:hypothetical protein
VDRGKIVYQLEIIDSLKRSGSGGVVTNSSETSRIFRSAGIAEPGAPQPFELGTLENGRRLIGVMVFRLAQPDDSPANDSPTAFISNPEFQQVINLEDTDRKGIVFFDFETGRLLKPPVRVAFDPNHPTQLQFSSELRDWIRKEDPDVMFVLQDSHWHAVSLDMEEQLLRNPRSPDSFTPQELEALVAPLTERPGTATNAGEITASSYFLAYTDTSRTPAAVFKTRKGTCGVYKWTSIADPKPGVKIRYRFWHKPDELADRELNGMKSQLVTLGSKLKELAAQGYQDSHPMVLTIRGQIQEWERRVKLKETAERGGPEIEAIDSQSLRASNSRP